MQRVSGNRRRKRDAAAKHNAERERKESAPLCEIRYSADLDRLYAVIAENAEPDVEKWIDEVRLHNRKSN